MKENKMSIVISVVVVLIVIAVLALITINGKQEIPQNNAMQNIQKEGVKITTLQEGKGEVVKKGDILVVNYTGKLANGTVFDSNVDPKFEHVDPFIFELGTDGMIKGWNMGIEGMKVGEKRMVEISPEFAYGEAGVGNIIPPNSTLTFEIELLEIKK